MTTGADWVPQHKMGYLSPLATIENGPYEFYRLAPEGVLMAYTPVGLEEFSPQDVERVYQPIEEMTRRLVERGVELVIQGGVPLPLLIGRDALSRVLERIEGAGGVPASSTVLCVVEAAQALGVQRIVVANKWSDAMNATLADFFAVAGVRQVGHASQPLAPAAFQKLPADVHRDLAYSLGRRALEEHPDADALYIGGSSWQAMPATLRLEQEFGKPVLHNNTSVVWAACRQLGCWTPKSGCGRLIATL